MNHEQNSDSATIKTGLNEKLTKERRSFSLNLGGDRPFQVMAMIRHQELSVPCFECRGSIVFEQNILLERLIEITDGMGTILTKPFIHEAAKAEVVKAIALEQSTITIKSHTCQYEEVRSERRSERLEYETM